MDYTVFHDALLIGEADYSFALAFAHVFPGTITATEYSSGLDIMNRYHDGDATQFAASLARLRIGAVLVLASLDARALGDAECCTCERWNGISWDAPSPFWKDAPSFDLIIFNFPHTDKNGKAPKLLRNLFKQLRICIHAGRLPPTVVVEMRLREVAETTHVRTEYKHEEAAAESKFQLIGTYDGDLHSWEKHGYEHRMTKRNATCRGMPFRVWRWRAESCEL